MFCRYCGKKISDNNKFCGHCGKEIYKLNMPIELKQQQIKNNYTQHSPEVYQNNNIVYQTPQNDGLSIEKTSKVNIGKIFIGLAIGLIVIGIYILATTVLKNFKIISFGFVSAVGLGLVAIGWIREKTDKGNSFLSIFMTNFGLILLYLTILIGLTLFEFYNFAVFALLFVILGLTSIAYAKKSKASLFASNTLIVSYVVSFTFALIHQLNLNEMSLGINNLAIVLAVSLPLLLSKTHTIVTVATSFVPFVFSSIISGEFVQANTNSIIFTVICIVNIFLYYTYLIYRVKADYDLQLSVLKKPYLKFFNKGSFMHILPYLIANILLFPVLNCVHDLVRSIFSQFEKFDNKFLNADELSCVITALIYLGIIFLAIKISDLVYFKLEKAKIKGTNLILISIALGFSTVFELIVEGYISTFLLVATTLGMFFIYTKHENNSILHILNIVYLSVLTFLITIYCNTSESDLLRVALVLACIVFCSRINKILFINILVPCTFNLFSLIKNINIFNDFGQCSYISVIFSVLFILAYSKHHLKKENLAQEPLCFKISRNIWCIILCIYMSFNALNTIFSFAFLSDNNNDSIIEINNIILLFLIALALFCICVLGLVNLKNSLIPGIHNRFEILSALKLWLLPLFSVFILTAFLDEYINIEPINQISRFIITATLFVIGAVMTYLGYNYVKNSFYILGTVTIILGVLKLSVYDVQSFNPTFRAIAFIAGGIVCLVAGIVLIKNKPKVIYAKQIDSISTGNE